MENIKKILIEDLSKTSKQLLITWVGKDRSRAELLWNWSLYEPDPLKWRSAWVLEEVCLRQPQILMHFKDRIAALYPTLTHVPLRRMYGHVLASDTIPEKYESEILDASLTWLQDPKQPAAVRVHCMQIAYNLTKKYPELASELAAIIEHSYDTGSAGFKNRGAKLLKKLR